MPQSFFRAGHLPTLIGAFLYFDLSFMVWVLLGPLGVQIADDLALIPAQKGMMVAIPVLAGAVLRLVMGVLVDHLQPKLAGIIGQVIVMATLLCAYHFGIRSYEQAPPAKSLTSYLEVLRDKDAWWFMFSYAVTFGGFVGAMLALGMGNGAVFKLVRQRFRREIGVMTGLVGMAGGIGGFYLSSSLGYSMQLTGSYQLAFLLFSCSAFVALLGLTSVKTRWRTTWGASHLTAARV